MNPEKANLPFPSPASEGATPPPATPVRVSNPQHVSSTPDTNQTLEDVLPRLKAELHRRHVPNVPLDAFLKHFVTLEDARYARCSSDDEVAVLARDLLNISENNLSTETELARNISEREIIPWLCHQANSISTSCLLSRHHSVSQKKPSPTTIAPHLPSVKWFYHLDLPLGTDSKNVRKMDFGLSWRDYEYTNRGSDRVHWKDVEVVGDHTGQQHCVTEKTVKLAEYARHALLHQPDRRFIFGFLVHRSDLYLYLFTSVGVISSKPFNLLQDLDTLQILIRGITHLPAEKRGRDINFRRVQNPRQPDRYRRFLDFKIAPTQTKRVEGRGAQRFIETAAEDAGAGHAVPRENYSEGRDCESLDAEVALLGPLYRNSALFGRRTHVWLAEMTVHKDNEVLGNNTSPTHIVIKIVSRDMYATLSEREILNKAADYENIDVPSLVPHIEFTPLAA